MDPDNLDPLELAGLAPEIETHAVSEYVEQTRREFADYLVSEAETTMTVSSFGTRELRNAVRELAHNNFDVRHGDDDAPTPLCFAHPNQFVELKHDVEPYLQFGDMDADTGTQIDGVECYGDASIPDGHAVTLHPDAIAPNYPRAVEKPWIVKEPRGVVVTTTYASVTSDDNE